jgi:hypothetical protein
MRASTTTPPAVEPAGTCAAAIAAVKTITAIKFVIARTVPSQAVAACQSAAANSRQIGEIGAVHRLLYRVVQAA